MISKTNYTEDELDALYSAVEEAVENNEGIQLNNVANIIKRGDFTLIAQGPCGIYFGFTGLTYKDDDNAIYEVLIRPQVWHGDIFPRWIPEITRDIKTHSSWERLHMIKKENRVYNEV